MALLLPFTITRPSQNKLTGPPVTDYVSWLTASGKVACNTSTSVVSNWNDEKNSWNEQRGWNNIGSWSAIAPIYSPSYRNGYGAITFNSTNPNTSQTIPISSAKLDFTTSNALTIVNAWIVNSVTSCRTLAGITPDGTTNRFLLWGQGMNGATLPATSVWLRTGNGAEYTGVGPTLTLSNGMVIVYTVTYLQTSPTTSTVTFSVNNANTITGNSTQFSSNQVYLTPVSEGSYSPPSYSPHRSTNSSMLETIAWNRILSSGEQSNVYNYLLAKFSIPTLSISGTTATVTLPVSYSGVSVTLFQNTIASTTGGSIFATASTSGTTATFAVTTRYFYYASVNNSTSYTAIVGAVPGPAAPLTDMTTWLNAGVGVVTTSGNVTTWYDARNYLNITGWSAYTVTSNASYINGYAAIMTPAASTSIPVGAVKPASPTFNWRTTSNFTYITTVAISNASSFLDINSISSGNNGYQNDLQITGATSSGTTIFGIQFGTGYASNTMPTFTAGSIAVVIGTYSYDGTTVTEKVSINNGTVSTFTSTNINDLLTSNVSLYPVSTPSITNGGNYPATATNGLAVLDKMLWTRTLTPTEQTNMYNYLVAKYSTTITSFATTATTATVTISTSTSDTPISLYRNTTGIKSGGTPYATATTTGNTATFSIVIGYYYYAAISDSTNYSSISYLVPSTGADQTFGVPTGVTSISVRMAGAGGGNTYSGGNGSGASGGLVSGTLAVTPSETLVLVVGSCGGQYVGAAYGGGGAGQTGGSGGGRSAIRRAGADIVTAAGGGGGGFNTSGGIGGGLTGGNGGQGSGGRGQGGFAGTQTAGGAGGYDATYGQAQGGSQYQGGTVSGGWGAYTGGGGGGYYGGGAGVYGGGGGGGSSYITNLTGTVVNTGGGGSTAEVPGTIIITY